MQLPHNHSLWPSADCCVGSKWRSCCLGSHYGYGSFRVGKGEGAWAPDTDLPLKPHTETTQGGACTYADEGLRTQTKLYNLLSPTLPKTAPSLSLFCPLLATPTGQKSSICYMFILVDKNDRSMQLEVALALLQVCEKAIDHLSPKERSQTETENRHIRHHDSLFNPGPTCVPICRNRRPTTCRPTRFCRKLTSKLAGLGCQQPSWNITSWQCRWLVELHHATVQRPDIRHPQPCGPPSGWSAQPPRELWLKSDRQGCRMHPFHANHLLGARIFLS